ncbi:MAG: tRNA pseudouridine(55) synthase TruB [Lentisphaerae bacterium]|nr:tRNA pseudouridine(55) synthase TruB [Lentisphaerota bacterium]
MKADARYNAPAAPQATDPWDGLVLVDKASGPTSHDIVAGIRRRFGIAKVGHGGALDPMATGLLVILLGRGTKLADQFTASDKAYEGDMHFGVATDSQDADGKVTAEADASFVTRGMVEERAAAMVGDMYQTPPMVSAVKVNGVPLYKRARKGEVIERTPRLIHVYRFDITDFRFPLASFSVVCTKGTYIRTLCADMGTALGCGAHLARLRRTRCGDLSIDDALPYGEVLRLDRDGFLARVLPIRMFAGRRGHGGALQQ